MRINLHFVCILSLLFLSLSTLVNAQMHKSIDNQASINSHDINNTSTIKAYSGSNLRLFNKKSNCLMDGKKNEKAVGFIHHDSYLDAGYTDNLTIYNPKKQKFIYDYSLKDLLDINTNELIKNEDIFKVSRGKDTYRYLSYCGITGNLIHIGNDLWLNLDELSAKNVHPTSLATYAKDLGRFAITKYPSILYLTPDKSPDSTIILPKGGNIEIIKDSCTDDGYCDIKFWKVDEYDPLCYITDTPRHRGKMQIIDNDFLPTIDEYAAYEGFCVFVANVEVMARTNNRNEVTHKVGDTIYAHCNEDECYAVNKCSTTQNVGKYGTISDLEFYKFKRVIDNTSVLQLVPGDRVYYDCMYDIDIH